MTGDVTALARDVLEKAGGRDRYMVAIAGPPAGGKSTLSEQLWAELERLDPGSSTLVPMDGYHYDDAVLTASGDLPRKGAPWTFDALGFLATLERIRAARDPVAVPVFDRSLELARAGARIVAADTRIILVEGNYLLLTTPPWDRLRPLFDHTIMVSAPMEVLEARLMDRWLGFGFDRESAKTKAGDNDLPNAETVLRDSAKADVVWNNS